MIDDAAGTPMAKKPEQNSGDKNNDGVPDTLQNSQSSQTYSDPNKETLVSKIKSRVSGVGSQIKQGGSNIATNVKAKVVTGAKDLYHNAPRNAARAFSEDVSELGHESVATVKQFGLTPKQAKKKYGVVEPTLGSGGFGSDILGRGSVIKVSSKKKSKKTTIKNKTMNVQSVGVVGSVFGSGSVEQTTQTKISKPKNIHAVGVIGDPFHGAFNSQKKKSVNINNIGVIPNTFGGSKINVQPLDKLGKIPNTLGAMHKHSKQLNGRKSNMSNMSDIGNLNLFKKKRGGLY